MHDITFFIRIGLEELLGKELTFIFGQSQFEREQSFDPRQQFAKCVFHFQ